MSSETIQTGVSTSRLVPQLLVLLVIASLLLSGCGAEITVYPGAKADESFEGSVASLTCFSSNNLIAIPGEQLEIIPQIYSTSDSLDTVVAWHKQNLTEWSEVGVTCENGATYVFPKECNASTGPCEKQLNIFDKESGGTWIVIFAR